MQDQRVLKEKLKIKGVERQESRFPRLWHLCILALLVVLATLLLLPLVDKSWFESLPDHDWKRNCVQVTLGSIDFRVTATGVIRPYNQVKVSPKQTGLLRRLLVQQGDYVKKGALLAIMDDSNLLGQVQAARAAYFVAKANYDKALHGNRPQEVADSQAQMIKTEGQVAHAQRAVLRAQAALKAAQAQVNRDEINARRLTDLAAQGAVSDQDRLNAQTQAEVSRAQVQQTQQELKQADSMLLQSKSELESSRQKFSLMKAGYRSEDIQAAHDAMIQAEGNWHFLQSQLADTRIKAPFDGVITQKYTDEGGIVTPTTAAATTSATSSSILSLAGKLELVASVSETDVDNIKVGQAVEIVANAYPDIIFHGTVERIAPEAIVTQNVTTFEVHATINDDSTHRLLSGMNVNSLFLCGRKDNLLLVPTASIISRQGKTGVLIPMQDGSPEFKAVKIGPTSGTQTAILEGLKQGELVYVGLTRAQLQAHGYLDDSKMPHSSIGAGSGKPQIPRGFGQPK